MILFYVKVIIARGIVGAIPDFVGAEVASDPGSLQRGPGLGGWCSPGLGCCAGRALEAVRV